MQVRYRLQGVEFEWDDDKARANYDKHGVTFEEAAEVHFDPFHVSGDATRGEEDRQFIIGYSLSERLLLTVYTERVDNLRIITARPATRAEKRLYEYE